MKHTGLLFLRANAENYKVIFFILTAQQIVSFYERNIFSIFFFFFGEWMSFLENVCIELSENYNKYVLLVDIYTSETNKIKSHWTWNGID